MVRFDGRSEFYWFSLFDEAILASTDVLVEDHEGYEDTIEYTFITFTSLYWRF